MAYFWVYESSAFSEFWLIVTDHLLNLDDLFNLKNFQYLISHSPLLGAVSKQYSLYNFVDHGSPRKHLHKLDTLLSTGHTCHFLSIYNFCWIHLPFRFFPHSSCAATCEVHDLLLTTHVLHMCGASRLPLTSLFVSLLRALSSSLCLSSFFFVPPFFSLSLSPSHPVYLYSHSLYLFYTLEGSTAKTLPLSLNSLVHFSLIGSRVFFYSSSTPRHHLHYPSVGCKQSCG